MRELRENLALWLDRAAAGEEVVITERGRPKAVIRSAAVESVLDRLEREGRLSRASRPRGPLPPPIPIEGSIMPFLEWAKGGPWPESTPGAEDEPPAS